MIEQKRIPIATAAMTLKTTREIAVRLVQRGVLRGGQDSKGKWYATPESVKRYLAEQRATANRHTPLPA